MPDLENNTGGFEKKADFGKDKNVFGKSETVGSSPPKNKNFANNFKANLKALKAENSDNSSNSVFDNSNYGFFEENSNPEFDNYEKNFGDLEDNTSFSDNRSSFNSLIYQTDVQNSTSAHENKSSFKGGDNTQSFSENNNSFSESSKFKDFGSDSNSFVENNTQDNENHNNKSHFKDFNDDFNKSTTNFNEVKSENTSFKTDNSVFETRNYSFEEKSNPEFDNYEKNFGDLEDNTSFSDNRSSFNSLTYQTDVQNSTSAHENKSSFKGGDNTQSFSENNNSFSENSKFKDFGSDSNSFAENDTQNNENHNNKSHFKDFNDDFNKSTTNFNEVKTENTHFKKTDIHVFETPNYGFEENSNPEFDNYEKNFGDLEDNTAFSDNRSSFNNSTYQTSVQNNTYAHENKSSFKGGDNTQSFSENNNSFSESSKFKDFGSDSNSFVENNTQNNENHNNKSHFKDFNDDFNKSTTNFNEVKSENTSFKTDNSVFETRNYGFEEKSNPEFDNFEKNFGDLEDNTAFADNRSSFNNSTYQTDVQNNNSAHENKSSFKGGDNTQSFSENSHFKNSSELNGKTNSFEKSETDNDSTVKSPKHGNFKNIETKFDSDNSDYNQSNYTFDENKIFENPEFNDFGENKNKSSAENKTVDLNKSSGNGNTDNANRFLGNNKNDSKFKDSNILKAENRIEKDREKIDKITHGKLYSITDKQFQLDFEREQKEDGIYRTGVKIKRGEINNRYRNQGVLHRTVNNVNSRITGDVPSLTKFIDSQKPTTKLGKISKFSAKATYGGLKNTANTALKTGLAAETGAIATSKTAYRVTKRKLVQKYRTEAVDDGNRASIFAATTAVNAAKGTVSHFKQKQNFKLQKAKSRLKKDEYKLSKLNYKAKNADVKEQKLKLKSNFNKHKASYLSSIGNTDNPRMRKAVYIGRKRGYKRKVKAANAELKPLKLEKKIGHKEKNLQRKLAKTANPGFLATKPLKYFGSNLGSKAYTKAVYADDTNDVMKVVDKTVRAGQLAYNKTMSKPAKQKRTSKKQNKTRLHSQKKRQNLKNKQSQLHDKKRKGGKKKINKGGKHRQSIFKRLFRNKNLKNAFAGEARKIIVTIGIPVFFIFLSFMVMLALFNSVVANSSWILGTYNSQDYHLSQAEEYYTKLGYDMNQNVLKCGSADTFKQGLRNLGVSNYNVKKMKVKPQVFTYGQSQYFNYPSAGWDFDPYKLWSFLCAYYYNFDSDNEDVNYWKYSSNTETLLKRLFEDEYEFNYKYDDTSGWIDFPDYYRYSNWLEINASGSGYDFAPTKIHPNGMPSELRQFADSGGYLHLKVLDYGADYGQGSGTPARVEILNPNADEDDPRGNHTGFYLADQRYYINHPVGSHCNYPFYTYYTDVGNYGKEYWDNNDSDYRYVPASWYTINNRNTALFYLVSQYDYETYKYYQGWILKNVALTSYYQQEYWNEDCILYYTVRQKKTFDEAIKNTLRGKGRYADRLEYYNLLVGDSGETSEKMYGNHMTLKNVLSGSSIRNYSTLTGFGYDMREWNVDSPISDGKHRAVDIICNSGSEIKAPLSNGYIKSYSNNTVVLHYNAVSYWYDGANGKNRDTEVTIENVRLKSGYNVGSSLKEGEVFAYSTNGKKCDGRTVNRGYDNIHIKVYLDTDGYGWHFIDSRLVFY